MTILITGINGMLGSYLAKALVKDGHDVIGLLRNKQSNTSLIKDYIDKIDFYYSDIREFTDIEIDRDIDYIIHCSALVSFQPKDRELLMDINVNGTKEVIEYCLAKKATLIHISSVAAIGRSEPNEVVTEDKQWKDSLLNTDYGISKFLAELEIQKAAENKLEYFCINPSIILGKGANNKSSYKIFSAVKKGLKVYPTGSSGFVSAEDIVLFCQLCLKGEVEKNQRTILNADNMKFKELFDLIATAYNVKPPSIPIVGLFKKGIILVANGLQLINIKPFVNANSIKTGNNVVKYDNSKSLASSGMSYKSIKSTIYDICK